MRNTVVGHAFLWSYAVYVCNLHTKCASLMFISAFTGRTQGSP